MVDGTKLDVMVVAYSDVDRSADSLVALVSPAVVTAVRVKVLSTVGKLVSLFGVTGVEAGAEAGAEALVALVTSADAELVMLDDVSSDDNVEVRAMLEVKPIVWLRRECVLLGGV